MSFDVENFFFFFSQISSRLSSAFKINTNFSSSPIRFETHFSGMICTSSQVSSVLRDVGTSTIFATVRCCKRSWQMDVLRVIHNLLLNLTNSSVPRSVPSHSSAPAPVAVAWASRLQEFAPSLAEQLREWLLSWRAPWPYLGTAHPATRCYRLRSGPKHQVRTNQTSRFFWRAVFAPHFPLAIFMVNSASAILRATFSSQSNCSVMILATLWRVTDVLISCLWRWWSAPHCQASPRGQ